MPDASEKAMMLDNLFAETKKLLSGKEELIESVESVLIEYESISKALIKEKISAFL
jgi:hypothetical protein